mmetsp:Transcript_36956/g.71302  ORF Transcript_36956/g.71302 Transcript_36956/m.71302 type:complete len:87 (-) Transcript_36956:334-594(-)
MNRSPTVVLALLMTLKGMPLREAYGHVLTRRRICPFKDNRKEIVKYEKELMGKNSMGVDHFTPSRFRELIDDAKRTTKNPGEDKSR